MLPITTNWLTTVFSPAITFQILLAHMMNWYRETPLILNDLMHSLCQTPTNGKAADTLPANGQEPVLSIGKTVSRSKTMTESATLSFGILSRDFNPLHFNEGVAQHTRFRGRIAHGFHTASLFSGVLAELCPWCVYLRQEMDFIAPVRPGDHITATGTITDVDSKGIITITLACVNQHEETVVRGVAIMKRLKEMYA